MLLLLVACAETKPAPRDLDTILHDLWAHYGTEDDDALATDMRDLSDLVDEEALPLEGTFSDLTADEVAAAGVDGPDPEPARGMYTLGFVACTPEQMERILVSDEQMTLYPDNYLAYERTYTSSRDAYDARDTHHLTWDTAYEVDVVIARYAAEIRGGAHYTPDGDAGPYLFSRTVMQDPATSEDEVVFDVDYQIEAFYPHGDGMVHAFGMWRHIEFSALDLDTEDDGTVAIILDGLKDWDESTTAICAEGRI